VCALNGRSWPITHSDSPQSCNCFYTGSPGTVLEPLTAKRETRGLLQQHLHHGEDSKPASLEASA